MSADLPAVPDSKDRSLQILKNYRSRLEAATGGKAYWDGGNTHWRYAIPYNSQDTPPHTEKMTFASKLVAKDQLRTDIPFTEEDMRVMRAKEDVLDQAKLDKLFFEHLKPFNDPVRQDILRKVMPGPFERAKKYLAEQADLQKEIQTKMLDELTEESLVLRIAMAENPEFQAILNEPIGPKYIGDVAATKEANAANEGLIQRGMFSLVAQARSERAADVVEKAKGSKVYTDAKTQHALAMSGDLAAKFAGHDFINVAQAWGLAGQKASV